MLGIWWSAARDVCANAIGQNVITTCVHKPQTDVVIAVRELLWNTNDDRDGEMLLVWELGRDRSIDPAPQQVQPTV